MYITFIRVLSIQMELNQQFIRGILVCAQLPTISIVSGPGRLEGNCVVNLPSWIDFELSSAGDAAVTHSGPNIIENPPGSSHMAVKNDPLTRLFH